MQGMSFLCVCDTCLGSTAYVGGLFTKCTAPIRVVTWRGECFLRAGVGDEAAEGGQRLDPPGLPWKPGLSLTWEVKAL